MRTKIAYAVFTLTDSGKDYMVKGNFGNDKKAATEWKEKYEHTYNTVKDGMEYPNGLFVKRVNY
jgi:hypothetical protein